MLKIETKENKYLYDNSSGYYIPFNNELKKVLNNKLNNIEGIQSELLKKYLKLNVFSEYIDKNRIQYWDEKYIKNLIENSYFMNLQLVLTGSCNLRCEYCMYSDKYPDHVNYNDYNMIFDTAKRAVDLFSINVKNKRERGINNTPSISFYGGEPLLQFDLMQSIVDYAKEEIPDIEFGITTNGILLTEQIISFMIENNFTIAVSLDGYKTNHDRNRKLANGANTFDIVWNNLNKIIELDINKDVQILLLCCVDKYTDLLELADFFYKNYHIISRCNVRISAINQLDTTYYEFCDKKYACSQIYEKQNQEKSLEVLRDRLEKQYYGDKTNTILRPFFINEISLLVGSKGTPRLPLNNSCIPGSKLTVLPTGEITPCEKTGNKCIIGNVLDGIDYKKISKITYKFSKLMVTCQEKKCPIRRVCSACFAYLNESDDLQDGFCKLEIQSKSILLKKICENFEKTPDYYDIFF